MSDPNCPQCHGVGEVRVILSRSHEDWHPCPLCYPEEEPTMSQLKRTQHLEQEIERLERQLGASRAELTKIRAECDHRWGDVVYDPEIIGGYVIPPTPGSGSHPPSPEVQVPRQETPKWFRTCTRCGLVQATTEAQIIEDRVPDFGGVR